MRQVSLFVGGMGCRRCVREVTARLRDVRGVETVSASGDSIVRLSGSMTVEDVLAAFIGTTYRPQVDDTSSGQCSGTGSSKKSSGGDDSSRTAFGKPGP
ncbi:MAG: hypothetical protein QOF53_3289 [Nocardioidaceae bacterium]|nr:hypothetical protein [Nocardioidaceae bacterium]